MTNFRGKAPGASDFREALAKKFEEATAQGQTSITIKSGDLHREVVGGYSPNRMPICCNVMHRNRQAGDDVLHTTPSGLSSTLTIRYKLPRQERQGTAGKKAPSRYFGVWARRTIPLLRTAFAGFTKKVVDEVARITARLIVTIILGLLGIAGLLVLW